MNSLSSRYGTSGIEIIDQQKTRINENVDTYNMTASNVDINKLVTKMWDSFESSDERKLMLEGINYYNGKSDIDDKVRYTTCGTKGTESTRLSNAKLHKNFMRKLARQKTNYLLGKPYSIQTEDDKYKTILEDTYFTKNLYRLVFNLLKESIKEGINWLNVYYDENGELQFRRVPGNQVKVFWEDREHTKISQLIHYYYVEVFKGDEAEMVLYADYYSDKGVINFVKDDNGFTKINPNQGYKGHFQVEYPSDVEAKDGTTHHEMVWERLPWIPLKYNEEETSLLQFIKSYQDEYEKVISTLIDIVKDIPEAIKVFKGYGGVDLAELTLNIAEFRAVLLDGDGAVDSLDTPFDSTSIDSILDRLRKDVYEDGSGVDVQSTETGDKSGVALKFLYSDLDLDSEELEQELNVFFEWLLWFIDMDIVNNGGQDYSGQEVNFKFNKSLIINESEKIDMINKSRDMIPDSILLPEHPFVDDVSLVEKEIEKQKKEEEAEIAKQMEMYNTTSTDPTQQQ